MLNSGWPRHAQQRLFAELHSMGEGANVVVVDVGCGLTAWTRRFWLRASAVLLVTATDPQALLDAYSLVKQSVADGITTPIALLTNQYDREETARDAFARFSAACQRFLSRKVLSLPALPRQQIEPSTARQAYPRVWESPNSSFGHCMLWLGRAVSDVMALGETKRAV